MATFPRGTSKRFPNLIGICCPVMRHCSVLGRAKLRAWTTIRRNAVYNSMARIYSLRRLPTESAKRTSPKQTNCSLEYFFGGFGGMLFVAAVISIICYKPLGLPTPDGSNLALGVLLFVVICIQGVFNAWQDWVCPQSLPDC